MKAPLGIYSLFYESAIRYIKCLNFFLQNRIKFTIKSMFKERIFFTCFIGHLFLTGLVCIR